MWFVYIIEADDGSLYTGVTTDVERRFQAHLDKKGAKFFYARRPVRICYREAQPDKSAALKREYAIKQLSREEKLLLIQLKT